MITLMNHTDAPIIFYSAVQSRLLCVMQRGEWCDRLVLMIPGEEVKRISQTPLGTMYELHLKETIAP